jgi:hypothetical protein
MRVTRQGNQHRALVTVTLNATAGRCSSASWLQTKLAVPERSKGIRNVEASPSHHLADE